MDQLQALTTAMTDVLRFRADVMHTYSKRIKSLEQAEEEGAAPVRPFQVRFADGARWVADEGADVEAISDRLEESLQAVIDPIRNQAIRLLTDGLKNPINEDEALHLCNRVQHLRGYDGPCISVNTERDRQVIGLDPSWVIKIDERTEAEMLAARLTDAMADFRRSVLNDIRIRMQQVLESVDAC